MRNAFFRTLTELAQEDDRIVLLVGDLGFSVVEEFAARFPRRFVNVGVAEQMMIGLAAGLALSGKVVVTYSIGNFPVMRCLEQVRNDVCYHRLPVKIVNVGGGFAYGSLGFSHHATEDLAVMRALPYMTVVAPGDPAETVHATRAVLRHPGPCYVRLGRAGDPVVHGGPIQFELGKAIVVRPGSDLTLIAIGAMMPVAAQVCEQLSSRGFEPRLLSMHTLKPVDVEAIVAAARETSAVITIEEHSEVGGLGGAVAEVLSGTPWGGIPFRRIALPSGFVSVAGTQEYLRALHGLNTEGIMRTIEPLLAGVASRRADVRQ